MKKHTGIILYKGPSQIDGKKILVLASGIFDKTKNEKTGDMIQTWIVNQDIPPVIARRLGYDYSVCGDCKHRHFGSCYVNIAHGPQQTYNAYHNDSYVMFDEEKHLELFKGRKFRLGSFGDPAAVPTRIWKKFCDVSSGFTGYTHQWNARFVDNELKKYCMASCDNAAEYKKAKSLGWRTFRVRMNKDEQLLETEFICPASKEFNRKTDCSKCKACMGNSSKTQKDPCIIVHGADFKIAKFKAGMKKIAWKEKYKKDFEYPFPKKNKKRVPVSKKNEVITM